MNPLRAATAALSVLVLALAAAGCVSPEATRTRGGAGADPGNWRGPAAVELHPAGQNPYDHSPKITPPGLGR